MQRCLPPESLALILTPEFSINTEVESGQSLEVASDLHPPNGAKTGDRSHDTDG